MKLLLIVVYLCRRLVEILRGYAGVDWQLASLACKVVHNFLDDPELSHFECLGEEVEQELDELLSDFTGNYLRVMSSCGSTTTIDQLRTIFLGHCCSCFSKPIFMGKIEEKSFTCIVSTKPLTYLGCMFSSNYTSTVRREWNIPKYYFLFIK